MKRLWLVILIMASLALLTIPVSASTIGTPANYGIITVTNNGSADASNVTANITNLSTSAMISAGFLNASANNTSIQTSAGADVAFMPGSASDPWMLFVPSASGNSYSSYLLYTGNVTGGKIRYFPSSSGMTSTDNATLELSDNFTIEQKGWVDTSAGANKNLISKSEAITANITASGSIMVALYNSETLYPNGAGDNTSITTLFGAATHWQSQLTNDGDTSYVESANAGTLFEQDTYNADDGSIPTTAVIDSVIVHNVVKSPDGSGQSKTVVRLAGVDVYGATQTMTTNYVDYSDSLSRPGGGSWAVGDIPNIQIGTTITPQASNTARSTQVYVVVNYHLTLTASSIATGEHTVSLSSGSSNTTLSIDGVVQDNKTKITIADNGNDWTFLQNGVMPYLEYQKIWVGGNLRQHITWQYNATAPYVFTDQSGNGRNAVPTFATTNSNAYVSALLGTFAPVTEAKAPSYSVSGGTSVYTTANLTGPFSVTSNVTGFPGQAIVEAIATAGETPSQLPWMMITGFSVIACSLLATFLTSKASRGRSGTTFVKLIVIYGLIGLFMAVKVYDFWMLALFTLPALTAITASRKYDPTG